MISYQKNSLGNAREVAAMLHTHMQMHAET